MKVIAFNGSPKGENSNSSVIVRSFFNGAQSSGAETEEVYLKDKTVNHCTGCFTCWFKTPGKCIFKDDMDILLEKYKSADIICFVTPVYTWNMTAMLKNFIDRLAPLKSPLLVQNGGDFDLKDTDEKNAEFVVIANAGFPGENNFDTISKVFASCQPVLEIYRNCGMVLKKDDKRVKEYLKAVSEAGMELVRDGIISNKTKNALNKDLMPMEEYIKTIGM